MKPEHYLRHPDKRLDRLVSESWPNLPVFAALPLPWDAATAPGEWNGNHNDRAFLMVGVPAYPFCASKRADL
jgi:hypothetical protein